jgi:hypothetical protein
MIVSNVLVQASPSAARHYSRRIDATLKPKELLETSIGAVR